MVGGFVITTAITILGLCKFPVRFHQGLVVIVVARCTPSLRCSLFCLKFLSFYTRKVRKKTNSPSIIALAQDHRNDIFAASAVVIGIAMSQFGYHWVDPGWSCRGNVDHSSWSWYSGDSTDDLMDTVPGRTLNERIHRWQARYPGWNRSIQPRHTALGNIL